MIAYQAISASPDFNSLFESAGVKYEQGSYEEALKLYKKASGIRKDSFECLSI